MKDRIFNFYCNMAIVILIALAITVWAEAQQAPPSPQQQIKNLETQLQQIATKIEALQEAASLLQNRIQQYNRIIGQGQAQLNQMKKDLKATPVEKPPAGE